MKMKKRYISRVSLIEFLRDAFHVIIKTIPCTSNFWAIIGIAYTQHVERFPIVLIDDFLSQLKRQFLRQFGIRKLHKKLVI